ncbi:helix-turn-helix transcriptional regulator [Curtobacterium ammoniigenes]|uniref:helix-turn-helix transcriptional regulator n=1 Tax=Curtobacterium ammoniigenes TaxID=395387 RepID=UPI000829C793|nr:LuxR family transcriptional regulator [Curtobacterium ammoniigenes]
MVIVRGAAGTGKTSLLNDWIQYAVERGTPSSELELISGAQLSSDRASTWDGLGVRTPTSWGAVRSRFNGVRYLVIDGLDHVSDPEVLADLARLVTDCGLQIVASERTSTGFETRFGRDIAVAVIDPVKLAFEQIEVAALIAHRGATVESSVLPALVECFGGWARGIASAVGELALERSRVWRLSAAQPLFHRVRESLVAELTAPLRKDWEIVAECCLLPFASVPLLRELGSTDSNRVLAEMERVGVGSWRRVRGHDRYEVLPVLRAVARQEFAALPSTPDSARIDRLTNILVASGSHPWEAVRLAADAGQWTSVSGLVRTHLAPIVRDHALPLLALLQAHPLPTASDPWLAYLAATIAVAEGRVSVGSATTELRRIDSALRGDPPLPGQAGALDTQVLRCVVARQLANYGRAETLARALSESVPATVARGGQVSADVAVQVGITFLVNGAPTEALAEFARVRTRTAAPHHLRLQAVGYSALISALAGDIRASRQLVEDGISSECWPEWRHSVWAIPMHVAAALGATEARDWQRAARHLRAVAMLPCSPDDWPFVAYAEAWASLTAGDGYRAFSIIRDAEGLHSASSESNYVQGLLAVIKADSLLMARQVKSAQATLRPFLDGRDPIVGPFARALLLSGNASQARVFVDRGVWRSRLNPRSVAELHIVRAIASARLHDTEAASAALGQAILTTEKHDLASPWWLVPRDELTQLCADLDVPIPPGVRAAPQIFDSGLTVPVLTRREGIVLRLLREPGSIEWIANQLGVSQNTVKSQVQSVYRKLGVKSRSDAVRVARDWQLFDDVKGRPA